VVFNRGAIQTNCDFTFVLVITTLKRATRVAGTCFWLIFNNITFINPSALVGVCKNFVHLTGGTLLVAQLVEALRYRSGDRGFDSH